MCVQGNTGGAGSGESGAEADRLPLAEALSRGLYTTQAPPNDHQRWPVELLGEPERTVLAGLVEAWWPERPIRELVVARDSGWEVNTSALSVVLAAAALNMPVQPERWTDVFASGALSWPGGRVAEWLRQQYSPDCQADALAAVETIREGRHLLLAATALGEVDAATARGLLGRIVHVGETAYLVDLLKLVAGHGHVELIRSCVSLESDPERLQAFWRVLALHGDVDAQLALVAVLVDSARDGERLDRSLLDWHAAARDERLVGPLGELLSCLDGAPDPMDGVQRSVRMALAATRSERALEIYDRLAQDPDRPERAFQWYPRDELARDLATEQVLRRLPDAPAEVLVVMYRLGFGA